MNTLSFAWRGGPGSGKRTQLLQFLEKRATKHGVQFKVKDAVWYMTKPSNGSADPDEEDEEGVCVSLSCNYLALVVSLCCSTGVAARQVFAAEQSIGSESTM